MKIRDSEVTDEALFLNRRELLRMGSVGAITSALVGCPTAQEAEADGGDSTATARLQGVRGAPAQFRVEEPQASYSDATSYNNFYEFGTGKRDPAAKAHSLRTEPWSVVIDGAVGKPGRIPLETLLAKHQLASTLFRLRW